MRTLYLFVVVCGLTFPAYATEQCKSVSFEKLDSITVKDLRKLTAPILRYASGSLSFSFFDEEDHPWKDNMYAVGFIMASLGDLDETPVAGYLWTQRDINPKLIGKNSSEKPGSQGNGPVTMKFSVPKSKTCPAGVYILTLQSTGDLVADGTIVGTVI